MHLFHARNRILYKSQIIHIKKNIYLFVFIDCAGSLVPFWILLIVAVHGLSLAVGSGEHSLSRCIAELRHYRSSSEVVVRGLGLSCFKAPGIFFPQTRTGTCVLCIGRHWTTRETLNFLILLNIYFWRVYNIFIAFWITASSIDTKIGIGILSVCQCIKYETLSHCLHLPFANFYANRYILTCWPFLFKLTLYIISPYF